MLPVQQSHLLWNPLDRLTVHTINIRCADTEKSCRTRVRGAEKSARARPRGSGAYVVVELQPLEARESLKRRLVEATQAVAVQAQRRESCELCGIEWRGRQPGRRGHSKTGKEPKL
eukprot:480126-Rhodomonas_salina.2